MMCRALVLILAAAVAGAQEISSPTRYVEQSFDVLEYDAFIALDSLPRPVLAKSTCTWIVRWRGVPDTLRVHLRSLVIDSVEYLEQGRSIPAAWFVRGRPSDATFHYAIPALPSHRIGDTVRLRITYHGTMTGEPPVGGYSWGGVQQEGAIVYALGVGFYNNYVSATQHWLACYDHPSDKAIAHLQFRVPATYVVASNGNERGYRDSSGWRIATFRTEYPVATYLLTFAALPASTVAVISDTSLLGVPIVLYARRSDSTQTVRSFRLLPRMVQTFERYFGAYPFEKVGYVMTQKGAMEHQTMISYPTSLARTGDTINLVAAHELAHQWFGDCVTPLDFRDAWFNESFATYCESLWLAELFGERAYVTEQQRKINAYLNQYAKPGNPAFEGVLPMYDFDRRPPSSNYPHVIYEKGAAVLGMLRAVVGDSVFFAWCRDILERYRYVNISIDTLEHLLQELVGQPSVVSRFFDEWIRGRGWAVLAIEAVRMPSPHGWKAAVSIAQVQPDSLGSYTTLPLELSFIGSDTVHRTLILTSREQVVEFDSLNHFSSIAINSGWQVRSLALLSRTPVISEIATYHLEQPLRVYPSPASDRVWIVVADSATVPVLIYDARGGLSARIDQRGVVALPTANLSSGIYWAVARVSNRQYVVPFTVVH
jgi:aminopeptidase N